MALLDRSQREDLESRLFIKEYYKNKKLYFNLGFKAYQRLKDVFDKPKKNECWDVLTMMLSEDSRWEWVLENDKYLSANKHNKYTKLMAGFILDDKWFLINI